MQEPSKTNQELIEEITALKLRIQELEKTEPERKRVEEELLENEEYTNILFHDSIIPKIIMDAETGIYIDCNEAAVNIYGYTSREEVIGKTPIDVSAPTQYDGSESPAEVEKPIQACRRDGSHVFEWRHQRPNGQIWDGAVHLMTFRHRGKPLMKFTLQDISERKKAMAELQESESRFRDLVELIPVVVYETDVNYRLTFANHRAVDLFGYSKEELTGRDSVSMIIPEDRQRLMENFMRRSKGEEIGTNDYIGVKKDGSKFPMLLQSVPIRRDGQLIGARGIVIDITERKQMEKKRLDTLIFLHTLFNTIPSPIFCKDSNGLYVDCNKEFEKYTGLKRKDIIGKCVYDMYSKDIADKYHEMDLALFSKPGRQIYEYPIIYADGSRHDVVVNKATYQNADGTEAGLVGVMVDITERKRIEQDLLVSQEKYGFLIRNTSDYIARYSLNGDLLFASEGMQFMLGYNPQEVIGTSGLDRVHPDDLSIVQEALKKASETVQGTDDRIEYRTMRQDGSYLWVELTGKTVLNNQTGNREVIATVRNINVRRQAENELAKYHGKLKQLVEERTQELGNKTKALEEVNIALKVLLQHREEDRKGLEDRFVTNVQNLIIPFAEKMKNTSLDERQLAYLGIIETHLKDITSSMITKFNQLNLTPTEVEIASLIKEGKSTKEIAKIMGTATSSIDTHRNNIRKKLGINKENVNLRSYLQSFN